MPSNDLNSGLFPALLRDWRHKRGLSQLDLALSAGVSSRHVSFLETGRSEPSPEMVLRLATALNVPLRHVNAMLRAADHEPAYPEAERSSSLPDGVQGAIELMKQHHEPFPLIVLNRTYDVLDMNVGASTLIRSALGGGVAFEADSPLNVMRLTFAEGGAGQVMMNFDEIGRWVLWRIQREVLADPTDTKLRNLLDEILAMPTISDDWREVDLTVPASPTLAMHLRVDEQDLRFVTMVTAFQAPQTVLLDELRIETWLPLDPQTVEYFDRGQSTT